MHAAAYNFVKSVVEKLDPQPPTYEIGSLNINGSVRPLFKGRYLGVDVVPGPDVDVVASAGEYFPDFVPNTIVCCEVLEHVPDPEVGRILGLALELLAPGGVLIITAAGFGREPHSAVDGGWLRPGEFYRNIPRRLLIAWLPDNKIKTVSLVEGDGDIYFAGIKPTIS